MDQKDEKEAKMRTTQRRIQRVKAEVLSLPVINQMTSTVDSGFESGINVVDVRNKTIALRSRTVELFYKAEDCDRSSELWAVIPEPTITTDAPHKLSWLPAQPKIPKGNAVKLPALDTPRADLLT